MGCCDGQIVGGNIPVPAAGAGTVIGNPFYTGFLAPSPDLSAFGPVNTIEGAKASKLNAVRTILSTDRLALHSASTYYVDGSHGIAGPNPPADPAQWIVLAKFTPDGPGEIVVPGVWAYMRVRRLDPIAGIPNIALTGELVCACAAGGGCTAFYPFDARQENEAAVDTADGETVIAEWVPDLTQFADEIGLAALMGVFGGASARGTVPPEAVDNLRIQIRVGGATRVADGVSVFSGDYSVAAQAQPGADQVAIAAASVGVFTGPQLVKITAEALQPNDRVFVSDIAFAFQCPGVVIV